jgi:hypothetical protein
VQARALAHEIGHVLGFRDNYFTVWRNDICGYEYQSREDDLMSNSDKGLVLPEHWEELARHYH